MNCRPVLALAISIRINPTSVAIAQFAMACNFHRIGSPSLSEFPRSIADHPRDTIGVGERIRLWWDIYNSEKMIALYHGEPSQFTDAVGIEGSY